MQALVLLVAAMALLVLPGAVIAVLAGARRGDALVVGPSVTTAVVGVACLTSVTTDTRWRPVTAVLALAVAVSVAALFGLAWRAVLHRRAGDDTTVREVAGGAGGGMNRPAAALVGLLASIPAVQVSVATGGLSAIPQNWDAIMHGAAVRFIADTGLAGPDELGPIAQPMASNFYYPNTYHSIGALLYRFAGGRPADVTADPVAHRATVGGLDLVPAVLDALSAATGSIFVVSVAVLAARLVAARVATTAHREETGHRDGAARRGGSTPWRRAMRADGPVSAAGSPSVAAVAAALTAAGCWTYPYAVLGRGPLLPFALGIALIPGLMLLAEHLAAAGRVGADGRPCPGGPRAVPYALLLGIGLAGAWSVHPSVALAAAVPLTAQGVAGVVAASGTRARLSTAASFATAVVPAVAMVSWTLSGSRVDTATITGFRWPRSTSPVQAVAEVFDLGAGAVCSVAIAVAAVIGVVVVLREGGRRPFVAPLVALVVYAVLFVLARAVGGDWVRVVTGYFWDDAHRFAALLVLPVVLFAAQGVAAIAVGGSVRRPAGRRQVVVVVLLAAAVVSGMPTVAPQLRAIGYGDGPAVRDGERRVLDRLAELYRGGTVFDDPFDGMSWGYALYGMPMLFPAPLAEDPIRQLGRARMDLYTSINRYGYEPLVTERVRELDVRWVVVGTGAVGGPGRPPGVVGLQHNPHLRQVARDDDAVLYRVLPVPPGHPALRPPPGIPARVPADPPPNTDSPLVAGVPASGAASLEPPP